MDNKIRLDRIEDAIEDFRNGKMVIVVDDEDRENEGDLIMAAEKITPEDVNFMLKNARGVLCAPITQERCRELQLEKQVEDNTSMLGTPFTVTVDKLEGCSTGVSAADRSATLRALADPASVPETFGRPGHVNPLYAQDRGVLQRAGHTEAAVDLCRLAGLEPAGVLMEIMNEDGTMARLPELRKYADEWGLKLVSIADLIAYRLQNDSLVERGEEVDLPTAYGHFHLIPFRQKDNGLEHVALIKGDVTGDEPVLVRVRHLRPDALRMRRAAAQGHAGDRQGGTRCRDIPQSGGTRHRTDGEDPGLQAAGKRHGHRRRQPALRSQGR